VQIKRTVAGIAFAAALIAQAGAGRALAQDATPVANGGNDLLKGLGLPELTVTVTTTDATVPASVAAGRVLLHVVNQTDAEVDVSIGQTPEGVTDQDILDLSNSDSVPDWLYQTVFPGGVSSYPPAQDAYAVIELAAGDWKVNLDRYPAQEGDPEPTDQVKSLTVTGEAAQADPIDGALDITAYSYGFELPESIASGPQIWHFRNGGSQPHFFVLFGVPEGTTADQLMQLVMFDPSSGTPIPEGGLQFEDIRSIGDGQLLSPDRAEWLGEDLTPGTYALVCFIPDRVTGQPHAMMGMIKIFTVQ